MLVTAGGAVAPGYGSRGNTRIDERPEPPAPPVAPGPPPLRPRRRRRSTGERVLRWSLVVLAVVLLIAGALYGYVRYRWSQVHTASCATCTAAGDNQPFNVLLVGSDSRAGVTGQQAQQFGNSSLVGGQRSDTIKILHVDPSTGTAKLLSIPRDTYVQMSDVPSSMGFGPDQKINTAFNAGPEALIATIQNTLGIPISHFVEVDFQGLMNAVNTVGGIYLDFPYPVRDNDNGNNNSGLSIPRAGCQRLNGQMTLALARSRFYQYYANGYWHYDPSSDIGRIQRQNIVIQAIAARARGSYNPLTINAFLGGIVHDVTVDKNMGIGLMLSLATTYHAFSPSSLQSFTLPVAPQLSPYAGDVEVVQQPQTEQVLTQFLGTPPNQVTTPPLSAYQHPIEPPPPTTTTTAPASPSSGSSAKPPAASSPSAQATSFDPTVCSG